jgi:hypothetical protein
MDGGLPVRDFFSRSSQLLFFSPRPLIPDDETFFFFFQQTRRIYVDNRLQHMLNLRFDIPFFQRGQFPTSVSNASQEIVVPNPWANRGNSAPFDQRACNPRVLWSGCQCSDCPPANMRKLTFFFFFRASVAFYLILDVAVGGTNGWFPDGAGDKPWLNGNLSACYRSTRAYTFGI